MIIIPRVLATMLWEVEDAHRRALAFDFAEHALTGCAELLGDGQLTASLAYVGAARAVLDERKDISVLAEAHGGFHERRAGGADASLEAMWIAAIAVASACQREMETAGILAWKRHVPNVADVARQGQMLVGRRAARGLHGDAATRAAREGRWDEAKWQVTRLIETVPCPRSAVGGAEGVLLR